MIVRKLSVNPPPDPNSWPDLANQLADLARTYLNPRLLPRQYLAAIALNSILALALLRSDVLSEVYRIFRLLRVPWFKQLVARRAEEIGHALASHFPDGSQRIGTALKESHGKSRRNPLKRRGLAMPAYRLEQQRVNIRQFDVLGLDSDAVTHFIRHVGLSTERKDQFGIQDVLPFTHMGPPLEHGSAPLPVQTTGSVPLNADEIQQVNVFIDERRSEYQAQQVRDAQYVIRPHVQPKCETDGTVLFYRFNSQGSSLKHIVSQELTFFLRMQTISLRYHFLF